MSKPSVTRRHRVAALATGFIGLTLATAAGAVDLRDWGRKFAPSERFVVLSQFNNQAVLDKETQLVWQRRPGTSMGSWPGAINGCLQITDGGRMGWRLPTVPEILSLVRKDSPFSDVGLPAGHPFQNVPSGFFWTNTQPRSTTGNLPTTALLVSFATGPLFIDSFAQHHNRWCVRGGGDIPQ
ncbi:MAG: DUF1566 domain-containing protein [Steroidobacteraceae bacterium]